MRHSTKKRRKQRAKRQLPQASTGVDATPKRRYLFVRWWGDIRRSAFVRGASTLTLFPQHPEVDFSVRAQREDLAEIWGEVHDCLRTAYGRETYRIREYERKK